MPGRELERSPTDDDRTRVLDLLKVASPVLGLDETDRRMDLAVRADSVGELALLVWDLPDRIEPEAVPAEPAGRRARRRDRARDNTSIWLNTTFRLHAAAYAMVNTMLVGIWALTDPNDLFWPFFPIAGWGIGIGMHGVVTHGIQRSRQEKEARQAALDAAGGSTGPGRPQSLPPSRRAVGSGGGRETSSPLAARTSAAVMFIDVVDSTRLTKVIGDEDWTRVRARYRDLFRGCFEANRGTEVSAQGDGFLARFKSPTDAARCAIQIQTRLETQRHQVGFAPAVRIGINCGEAMDEGGDLLGTVVNVAARVTGAAHANEILVTETVADHLDESFHLVDGGLRELKGLDRSAHVLSVTWAS